MWWAVGAAAALIGWRYLGWPGLITAAVGWWVLQAYMDPMIVCRYCGGSTARNEFGTNRRTFHQGCTQPRWLGGCGGRGSWQRWSSRMLGRGRGL